MVLSISMYTNPVIYEGEVVVVPPEPIHAGVRTPGALGIQVRLNGKLQGLVTDIWSDGSLRRYVMAEPGKNDPPHWRESVVKINDTWVGSGHVLVQADDGTLVQEQVYGDLVLEPVPGAPLTDEARDLLGRFELAGVEVNWPEGEPCP